jgi:hypothetical protein
MSPQISILSNLRIVGALVLDQDETEFPAEAGVGTLLVKGASLYAYLTISGVNTWYPIVRNLAATHIHTQGASSLVWTVTHNLDTADLWYQVQDADGQIINFSSLVRIDNNSFELHFTEPVVGVALVVGANTIDVPALKTSLIEVGGSVLINTSGVYVNGISIMTYDFTGFVSGKPAASAVVFFTKAGRSFIIPAGLGSTQVEARVAATAQTVFTLNKNGTAFGTITFAPGAIIPTLSAINITTFVPGDKFTIVAPATADATLADIAMTIIATLA